MGETTDQIAAHIEDARENLGSNLDELEHKVRSVADWKHHFQTKPLTMLGMAFGGGIVLAAMVGGRKKRRQDGFSRYASGADPQPGTAYYQAGTEYQKHQALETWDNIKGALIGVAAARFKDFVGEVVPGFHEQFQRTEEKAALASPARQS